MTKFKKYKSIENHYREKYINDTLKYHPEYTICKYAVSAKIDGANFQIKFSTTLDGVIVEYGKRGSMLGNESFYGMNLALEDPVLVDFIGHMKEFVAVNGISDIIMYGELFGPGVQNRIDYGVGKKILFYDACQDGEYWTQHELLNFMSIHNFASLLVPQIGVFDTLEEALAVDVETLSCSLNPVDGNIEEGVVIKPYDVIARNKDDEQVLFYIKKKSEVFAEKMSCKRVKVVKETTPEFQEALATFELYLSPNRMMSVFSKEGEIESPKDMGRYIKLFGADARSDYIKDNNEQFMALDDKERGSLFKIAGKAGAKILKEYL